MLPPLPRALKNLSCQYNQLTRLPPLSPFLRVLHCENNLLTQLPLLPITLKDLYCKNNQLTCFPTMIVEEVIQHLEIISYYGNPFSKIIERHDSSFIEYNYERNKQEHKSD
jgi:Leucine-rich repeat (LRR) protein